MKENSGDANNDINLSARSANLSLSSKPSPHRARRTVSFRDKDPSQSLETVHQVESLKNYNASEEKSLSCLKCNLL